MIRRAGLFAAGAALLYGGWGFLVSLDHGLSVALRVLCGQGAFSAAVTLGLATVLEALFHSLHRRTATIGLGLLLLHGCALLVHTALGTPRPLVAMAPGLVVGTLFVLGYVRALPEGDPP